MRLFGDLSLGLITSYAVWLSKKIPNNKKKLLTFKMEYGIIKTVEGDTPREREEHTMRTIIYAVINKDTKEKVYQNCRQSKCEEFIANLPNKDNYKIGYKWMSF